MRVALFDRGHWHRPMYLEAFSKLGLPLEEIGADGNLDAALAARPDLLVVLGTPQQMLGDLRRCVEAGIPAATEKPVGRAADELAPLAELARQRGAFVDVAQPHLLGEFWDACAPQQAGPLSHLRLRLVNGSPHRYAAWGVPWVTRPEVSGGGVLRNLGVHGVSAFLKATGGEVRVHSCVLSRRLYGMGAEEYAAVTVSAGGVIGHIEVGYTAALDGASEFELSAHGRDRTVRDDGQGLTVIDRRLGQTLALPATPLAQRYGLSAAATVRALREGRAAPHTLEDHLAATRVIDACYASATWADA